MAAELWKRASNAWRRAAHWEKDGFSTAAERARKDARRLEALAEQAEEEGRTN